MDAHSPLGMVSDIPSEHQTMPGAEAPDGMAPAGMAAKVYEEARDDAEATDDSRAKDYFVTRDGVRFAGTHLLVDLWGARNLTDPHHIDVALREAALAARATILHSHFHHFGPDGGVSGVVVLAESHISIHTWPERAFAAVDIFMCGSCNPYDSLPVLKAAFAPETMSLSEQRRGLIF
jgi:S-adenosylmethionine decarboxylase